MGKEECDNGGIGEGGISETGTRNIILPSSRLLVRIRKVVDRSGQRPRCKCWRSAPSRGMPKAGGRCCCLQQWQRHGESQPRAARAQAQPQTSIQSQNLLIFEKCISALSYVSVSPAGEANKSENGEGNVIACERPEPVQRTDDGNQIQNAATST
jgi:hypothetical protein